MKVDAAIFAEPSVAGNKRDALRLSPTMDCTSWQLPADSVKHTAMRGFGHRVNLGRHAVARSTEDLLAVFFRRAGAMLVHLHQGAVETARSRRGRRCPRLLKPVKTFSQTPFVDHRFQRA